jgi:hypothetical protein
VTAALVETKSAAPASQALKNQQRTALLAGVIVSVGWFAAGSRASLAGSLSHESSSGAISLGLGWIAAGVITGLVL